MSYIAKNVLNTEATKIKERIDNLKSLRSSYLNPAQRMNEVEEILQKFVTERIFVINSKTSQELPTKELYESLIKELSNSLVATVKIIKSENNNFLKNIHSLNTEINCLEKFLVDLEQIQLSIEDKTESLKKEVEILESGDPPPVRKPGTRPQKIRDTRNYAQDVDK